MTGRIRTIKPEWLEDELLAAASDEARVLSVALILMSDDYGRGRASRATLANGAWRFEMDRDDGERARETLAKASRALRELVAIHFVRVYEVAGQQYFEIRNWTKHQKVDKPSKPRIPEPPADIPQENRGLSEPSRDPREEASRPSRDPRETLATDLRPPTTTTTTTTSADLARAHAHAHAHAREAEVGRTIDTSTAERARSMIAAAYREHAPAIPRRVSALTGRSEDTAAMAGMSLDALPGILRRFFADRDMKAKGWPVGHLLANASQWSDVATGWKRDEGAPRERPTEDEIPPWVLAERETSHG